MFGVFSGLNCPLYRAEKPVVGYKEYSRALSDRVFRVVHRKPSFNNLSLVLFTEKTDFLFRFCGNVLGEDNSAAVFPRNLAANRVKSDFELSRASAKTKRAERIIYRKSAPFQWYRISHRERYI